MAIMIKRAPSFASEFRKTQLIASTLKIAGPLESIFRAAEFQNFQKGNGNPEFFVDG